MHTLALGGYVLRCSLEYNYAICMRRFACYFVLMVSFILFAFMCVDV